MIDQQQVNEFHKAAKLETHDTPQFPTEKTCELRIKLIDEEFDELDKAIGEEDIVEVADALGDLLYVVLGAGLAFGINLDPVFQAIHESNMTKFIDGHEDPETGKWIKGESYTPVNLVPILNQQGANL